MIVGRTCSVEGCGKPVRCRGYCNPHYIRVRTKGDINAGGPLRGGPAAFIEANAGYGGDECLLWPFSRINTGYGHLTHKGRSRLAHRMMCEASHGPPPTSRHVAAHSCGKGHTGCISPVHLRWATYTENDADRVEHGTSNHGVRNGHAVLTPPDVLAIVAARGAGAQLQALAERFGVAATTVHSIVTGRTWSWLTGIPRVARRAIIDGGAT